MPQGTFGTLNVTWPENQEPGAKVRITTQDGNTFSAPFDDLAMFIYGAWILPQRAARNDMKGWREDILGR
jgi:hypothetical protein